MSSITEQVGRVVGGRYRLLAPIGAGASSQVFASVDTRLSRRVAVKVLHPSLAADAAFLRRFRAEARLAASLDHPHVMRVFDWGEEHEGPYLVLELLTGGSLRAMLDEGHRLSHAQVAAMGAEAASGLAYAHRRGIIHRDIKPGNLLFDEDGHLRIADFGVARAIAEAALTEPNGVIFGTARYASPEQAEGAILDDRTDVYSLALVLYESLVGRVPFSADTVSATLMARVGSTLPPARELGPLAGVLAAAAIPEPLARLDAASLADELEELGRTFPIPARLPLAHVALDPRAISAVSDLGPADRTWGSDATNVLAFDSPSAPPGDRAATPDVAGVAGGAAGAGRAGAAGVGAAEPAPTAAAAETSVLPGAGRGLAPPRPGSVDETGVLAPTDTTRQLPRDATRQLPPVATPAAGAGAGAGAGVAGAAGAATATASAPKPRRRRGRLVAMIAAGLLAVALVAAGATVAVLRFGVYGHVVPRLTGDTVASARTIAANADMKLVVANSEWSKTVPAGEVIGQSIRPGRREKASTVIAVTESKGPPPVPVPKVVGMTQSMARQRITSDHLVPKVVLVYSETVGRGKVVSQSPTSSAPRQLRHTIVVLDVSKGPHPRIVPGVVGVPVATAIADLHDVQLRYREAAGQYSTTIPQGDVISETPGAKQSVNRGTVVTIVPSLGQPFVTVPRLRGLSVSKAEADLTAVGLNYVVYGPKDHGFVVYTTPSKGQQIRRGQTVTLYVA